MFLKGGNKTFLSKLLQPNRRAFGKHAVQAFNSAYEATVAAEQSKEIDPAFNSFDYQAAPAYSRAHLQKKINEEAAEAEWLSQLRSPQQKEGIFAKIAAINESDHEHLKQVKKRIDKLVQQELEALRFEE